MAYRQALLWATVGDAGNGSVPVGCLRLQVMRQSRLYESAPAYVTDQPVFLNAALAVRTALSPRQLLAALKHVEVRRRQLRYLSYCMEDLAACKDGSVPLWAIQNGGGVAIERACMAAQAQLGRQQGGQRYGPRPLDLDIIFYGSASMHEAGLEIPHPRWHERPFVQVATHIF